MAKLKTQKLTNKLIVMRKKTSFMRLFSLVSLFLIGITMYAQEMTVTGSVTDGSNGELMPGVTVQLKGTTSGTVTSIDGDFSLKAKVGDVLIFSFIGYVTQELPVASAQFGSIKLESESIGLDDVVVIGYGTQKKSDKTGAVSQVKASEMSGGVVTDPMQAIAGKSAGVLVTKKGGDPNAGYSVKIRGASGFDAKTEPLYVIDGIVGADETAIAPEDIETFNVLKDAASTAIYGSRGSNGVIIITTKKGSEGNMTATYSGLYAVENVANTLPVMSASELRSFAAKNNIPMTDNGADTDWQDEFFQQGSSQQHNLNVSGGSAKSSYYGSVSYYDFQGVVPGTSKERTIGKVNLSHKALNDKLTISGTLSGMFENNDYEDYNGYGQKDVLYQTFVRHPTDPVMKDGSYFQTQREFNYVNPFPVTEDITNTREAQSFMSNIKGDLEITKHLIGSLNFAYTRENQASRYFIPKGSTTFGTATNGEGNRKYNNDSQKILEALLTYNNTFNDVHNLTAMGGYSWLEHNWDSFKAQGRDAQSNYVGADNLGTLVDVVPGDIQSDRSMSRLIGFFARVQYNYDSKYYLSGSIRRDGSSKFGENNKWGIFPTVAAGWNIDREGFMESASDWLSQLKIRGSFGISGNQEFDSYKSQVVWQKGDYATNPNTGLPTVTFNPAWNSNPDLRWEQTSEVNIGLDFAFFSSRLSGSLEVYSKETKDMLGEYDVPAPPNLSNKTFANSGSMTNKGVELFVKYNVLDKKNFRWSTSLNVSHNQQEMTDLGPYAPANGSPRKEGWLSGRGLTGNSNYVSGIQVGQPLGSFYLPEYRGINSKGDMLFTSNSGGVTSDVSNAKRSWVGNALPDAEIGWSNNLTIYKNWGVDFSFRALIGNDVYNATKMIFDAPSNVPALNGFSEAVDWYNQGRRDGPKVADIYVEDASFIRLDYVSVYYNVPLKNKTWFKSIKVIANANNLFVLTGYSGIDPETSYSSDVSKSPGIDQYNVYPKTRAISLGLNATF